MATISDAAKEAIIQSLVTLLDAGAGNAKIEFRNAGVPVQTATSTGKPSYSGIGTIYTCAGFSPDGAAASAPDTAGYCDSDLNEVFVFTVGASGMGYDLEYGAFPPGDSYADDVSAIGW